MVFLALTNRIFLFFSTNLAVAQCSTLWCKGTSKAAIQTNASNISTGEWCVTLSKKGWSNKLRNSNTISKAITPKNSISLVLVIKLRLSNKNKMMNVMMPRAIKANWIFCNCLKSSGVLSFQYYRATFFFTQL